MSGVGDGPLTAMALCWRLERPDGAGVGLTSHDRTVEALGSIYTPAPGMVPSAITRTMGLNPHSGDIGGALSSDVLSEEDLGVGRWNGSSVALDVVDWETPGAGSVSLLGGFLGEIAINGGSFSAELTGAAARLEEPVCPATSAECRARFGDERCRVDLAGRTTIVRVVSADGGQLTLDREVEARFVLGRSRYLDGANCGLSSIVLAAEGRVVHLREAARGTIAAGERIELREGCDKRFATCVERFGNAVNFRGEPHLPGNDLLTRYPGA